MEAPAQSPEAQPQASQQPDSFFPSLVKPQAPTPPPTTQDAPPEWFIMEGLKGEGERPAFLSPKYKTLADQAKAYTELEKKLGVQKAPDKYDLSKYEDILAPDSMSTQKLLSFAQEKHLGQDVLDGVLGVFSDYIKAQTPDYSKEVERLGPKGREKVEVVAQWAANTFSEQTIEAINRMPKTADLVMLLDEMRQYQFHASTQVPAGSTPTAFVPLTVKEVEDEMKANFTKYNTDAKYRAEIKAKFAQAMGEQ